MGKYVYLEDEEIDYLEQKLSFTEQCLEHLPINDNTDTMRRLDKSILDKLSQKPKTLEELDKYGNIEVGKNTIGQIEIQQSNYRDYMDYDDVVQVDSIETLEAILLKAKELFKE